MSSWRDARMAEWISASPLTALAARTPTEPAYADRLHAIASELDRRGERDRAYWVWNLYASIA